MAEKKTAKGRAKKKVRSQGTKPKRTKAKTTKAKTTKAKSKSSSKKAVRKKTATKKTATKKKASAKKAVRKKANRSTEAQGPAVDPGEQRYQRPEPQRTQPHRAWQGEAPSSEMPHMGPFGTRRPWSHESSAEEDGSRMGYDVVNRHIHEGWDASAEPRYGTENPLDWLAEQARHGFGPGASAGQRWLEGLDALGGILRALGLPKSLGFRQSASGEDLWKAFGFNRGETSSSSGTPRPLVLRLASRRPVEVQVDLGPAAAEQELRAHLSHTEEAHLGRVIVVQVTAESGLPCVSLEVADEMPGGLYSGALMDSKLHQPAGTITLRVYD